MDTRMDALMDALVPVSPLCELSTLALTLRVMQDVVQALLAMKAATP